MKNEKIYKNNIWEFSKLKFTKTPHLRANMARSACRSLVTFKCKTAPIPSGFPGMESA